MLSLTILFSSRVFALSSSCFHLKPSGYDFKQWIDDYMTLRDESYVAWIKEMGTTKRDASSSK
jgi:hypothetical protein